MSCLFCDISAGSVPAEIVWRGSGTVAFLAHRPLFPGHVLLIPEQHVVTLADLPGGLIAPFFEAAQVLERAVEAAMEAGKTGDLDSLLRVDG